MKEILRIAADEHLVDDTKAELLLRATQDFKQSLYQSQHSLVIDNVIRQDAMLGLVAGVVQCEPGEILISTVILILNNSYLHQIRMSRTFSRTFPSFRSWEKRM